MDPKPRWLWVIPIYALVLSGALALASVLSRTATVMAENAPSQAVRWIILDPGHGGEDGGAVSLSGIPESQYNLQISLRLEQVLRFLGHPTHMLRREDRDLHTQGATVAQRKVSDLKERIRLIGQWENPLLISIHQNYFSQGQYAGPQVFYANTPGSRELAQKLQLQLNRVLAPNSRREEKQARGIYLMEHIQCQGLLVECGFLSNPVEEALLGTGEYQTFLVCIIATELCGNFPS